MNILICTDGSPNAEAAAQFFARLPHELRLNVRILSVLEPIETHGSQEVMAWLSDRENAERNNLEEANKRISKMFEGANVELVTKIRRGHASKEILAEINDADIDLVVIGAKGHSQVERIVLGSVSDNVATHAPCSVLVIRPDEIPREGPIKIAVGYDNSVPAQYALDEFAQFGWKQNTHVDLLGVVNTVYVDMNPPVYVDMEPVRKAIAESLHDAARSLEAHVSEVTTHVLDANHTGYKIVDFAEKTGSRLILLGNTSTGAWMQFLLGSVSSYVLRHAGCSVWIARDKRQQP